MIDVQKLKELTNKAIQKEQERQTDALKKEQAAEERERKKHQLMAENIIAQIEDKCVREALMQRTHVIVMSLKDDRDYDRKIWPQTPNKQTIRGPGKIVFDFCEKEGLMPTIEYWHDGMGLESGYNIIVRWN